MKAASFLAFPPGIEPGVYRLGGDCVILLRYGNLLYGTEVKKDKF